MTTQLVRYEQARTALAAVHSYDEVKDIMDQAERAAVYARQANDSDLIKYATEIRVRAQRRAGEMLAQTEKATGAKGIGPIAVTEWNRNQPVPATLEEIGVTKKQSSNWQALASMTEEHFEATVEAAKDTSEAVAHIKSLFGHLIEQEAPMAKKMAAQEWTAKGVLPVHSSRPSHQ